MVRIIVFRHIALVVNEAIHSSCFCAIDMRKILEIKAFFVQLLLADESLPLRIQFFQYIVVSRKDGIDVPDEIRLLVILFVVVAVAARVAAELFI